MFSGGIERDQWHKMGKHTFYPEKNRKDKNCRNHWQRFKLNTISILQTHKLQISHLLVKTNHRKNLLADILIYLLRLLQNNTKCFVRSYWQQMAFLQTPYRCNATTFATGDHVTMTCNYQVLINKNDVRTFLNNNKEDVKKWMNNRWNLF